ncbi:unnamed protein product [Urochloa decumbens]|uniref:Uncharacterized protein n=1 Tax=Urochloa decumbens TaxID=240449 RepID=A0ABC9DLF1_9POAL
MGNSRKAMFFLTMLIGSLALPPTVCRRHDVTNVVNSTSSKVYFVFCAEVNCDYFDSHHLLCYCCPDDSRREYCHPTLEECRANCASCQPKCLTT